jgi:membrane associated rhomboid family serine protease
MSNPVVAWIVIGAGVLLVLISAFADPLGLGRYPGFGWRQTVGVIIGALVIAAGLYLRRRKTSP